MEKEIKISLEQAKELLKTTPSLTDVIYSNFPELKPKKRWFEEYEGEANFHIIKNRYTDFNVTLSLVDAYYIQGFKTKEQAEQHAQRLNLYTEMQVFANFRNGDWVADWKNRQIKYGIILHKTHGKGYPINVSVYGSNGAHNCYIFQIAVKSEEIAEEMLEEFGVRIAECFNLN